MFLVRHFQNAIFARDKAIENNEKMKNLLEQFIGTPAHFKLHLTYLQQFLGTDVPDLKPILRGSQYSIYKPATAAMSLVLRAGIDKQTKATFELIRENVAKINNSILNFCFFYFFNYF